MPRLRQKDVIYVQLREYREEAAETRLGRKRGQIRHVPGSNLKIQGWSAMECIRIIREAFEQEAQKEAARGAGEGGNVPEVPEYQDGETR